MLISYVIGGGIFAIGVKTGFIKEDGNIRKEIVSELMTNPAVAEAVLETATTKTCRNNYDNFELVYKPPLRPMSLEGNDACRQWQLPGSSGEFDRVVITSVNKPAEVVMQEMLFGLNTVLAEGVVVNNMKGTKIQAIRDEMVSLTFVIQGQERTLMVEALPISEVNKLAVEEMVQSMVF
jgi:hypothetical protein